MKKFLEKLYRIDRRILFLLVFLVVAVPIFRPLNLPGIEVTDAVKGVYDEIEALPAGTPVLVSFDFDPGSKPELSPMGVAILRHAFRKNLRVVVMTLWFSGPGLADEVLSSAAAEYKKEYGKDYTFLGYQAGNYAVITGMVSDIYKVFPKDAKRGADLETMPVMKGIKNLKDFGYVITLTAGFPGIDEWIAYGSDKLKFKMGAGCTAVTEASARPYLQAKQLTGLIAAMKGASEYEKLIGHPDKASAGMDAIGMGHFMILALVVLTNAIMLILKYL